VEDGRQKVDRLQAVAVVVRPEGVVCTVYQRLLAVVRPEGAGYMGGRQMAGGRRLGGHQRDAVADLRTDGHPLGGVVGRQTADRRRDVAGGLPLADRQRDAVGDPRMADHRQVAELKLLRFVAGDSLGLVVSLQVAEHQDGFFRRCRSLLLGMYHHWLHTMADAVCRSKIVAFAILR